MMLSMKVKELFFDRAAVMRRVDASRRAALSKAGAFVRRAAKSSIKPRRRASLPGEPPSSHTGLLRNFIYFAYDESTASVVVGPVKLNNRSNAPAVLEFGGRTTLYDGKRRRTVFIRPRPYMGPALKQEMPRFPGLWRGVLRG